MSVQTTASTCQGCLSNCSIHVTVRDGAIERVEGNPANTGTRGACCRNVRMLIEQQSDPDRVLYPLRRTNPRKGRDEDPGFVRVTWDEALGELADRLIKLRNSGQGHRVAFAKGRSTGLSDLLMKALPDIYGTPNRLNHDGICAEAEKVSTSCLDGTEDYHDYDFAHTRYVIMWGTDPLAGNRMKARFLRDFRQLRKRAGIAVVSPHRSVTAEAAHSWLAVMPGTDGALACAMAHVMLVEGLWNRAYVGDFAPTPDAHAGTRTFRAGESIDEQAFCERHTHGLVRWWNSELKSATPEWASALCGIEPAVIRATARAFAAAGQRAISWVSPGVAMCARGLYASMACYALNGLAGSIGAEGGVLRFPSIPVADLPDTAAFMDDTARAANAQPTIDGRSCADVMAAKGARIHANQLTNRTADNILGESPYELEVLIAYWVNWAYSCTGAQRWEEALAKLPFFAYVTTHLSETAQFADIVLPARHHAFEDWGFARSRQGGVACATVQQPCVESPGECRGDETDFPFDLAVALAARGFDAPLRYFSSFSCPRTREPVRTGRELGEAATAHLLRPLWDSEGRTWDDFLAQGTWCSEPVRPRAEGEPVRALPTPTGRFEFASEKLRMLFDRYAQEHGIDAADVAAALGYEARGERALVPHYEPPARAGDPTVFPLVLHQHRSRLSLEGRAANTRFFQDHKGEDPGDDPWADVIKLHPTDMTARGLSDGDAVRVSSAQGSIVCQAKSWDGTRPGVAVKCYGQGHWAYGHVAALDFEAGIARGGNNNELIPAVYERISGATARHGGLARIQVEKCSMQNTAVALAKDTVSVASGATG